MVQTEKTKCQVKQGEAFVRKNFEDIVLKNHKEFSIFSRWLSMKPSLQAYFGIPQQNICFKTWQREYESPENLKDYFEEDRRRSLRNQMNQLVSLERNFKRQNMLKRTSSKFALFEKLSQNTKMTFWLEKRG